MKTLLTIMLLCSLAVAPGMAAANRCAPTAEDEMGPFYRPGAPLRSTIGSGYLLSGTVKSAADCRPIAAPLIEFWQADTSGHYSDAHRAAIITDDDGRYRLETDAPAAYVSRPPHIHIRVSAKGFKTLVTQHYLKPGDKEAVFDLVLERK